MEIFWPLRVLGKQLEESPHWVDRLLKVGKLSVPFEGQRGRAYASERGPRVQTITPGIEGDALQKLRINQEGVIGDCLNHQ